MVVDGSGGPPIEADVAVHADRIAAIGKMPTDQARLEVDARGMVVAPGFINMLSWAGEALLHDGRSQSDIRQGVTLEIMGEGFSYGPWNEPIKAYFRQNMPHRDIQYEIEWTTLGEHLDHLAERGVSPNIASFVGMTTLRVHECGFDDRPPTPAELETMRGLTRQAMLEGAMGVSSALIYPPAAYSKTDELIALAQVAAEYDGLYISHLRSEGNTLFEAFDEFLTILRASGIRGEIYHLKVMGQRNWDKLDEWITRIERAQNDGLSITADMYPYPAGATGLDSSVPPWAHEGGRAALNVRLTDPETRARILEEMRVESTEWENMRLHTGSADKVLLTGFATDALRRYTGWSLAQVAAERGTTPEETILNLLVEDNSRIDTVYFTISEANLRRQLALPWVSFCSDELSVAPEGLFLKSNPHPRAYGAFARVLGKYARDEGVLSLTEAIRRLAALPAEVLRIGDRGQIQPGYFADVVVFDPDKIQDHATFAQPHQYATGMQHVFVNGVQVLAHGEHTGALPGRVVRGPGWRGAQ
ncbi:MAG: D-aminoacylase [Chloroflexi bacterium]|nr:D-aminoacylase [Chloroflexota bacterium]